LEKTAKKKESLKKIEIETGKIEITAEKISKSLSDRWNENIDGKRLLKEKLDNYLGATEIDDDLDDLNQQINEESRKHKASKNNLKLQKNISYLKENTPTKINFTHSVKKFLETEISSTALDKIKNKIKKAKEDVNLSGYSHQGWFESGLRMLNANKGTEICPLCDTKLNDFENIVAEYSSFFNDEFKSFQDLSEKILEALSTIKDSIYKNKSIIEEVEKIIAEYSLGNICGEIDEFDFDSLLNDVKSLREVTEEKTRNLDRKIKNSDLKHIENFEKFKNEFNTFIEKFDLVKKLVLKKLDESNFNEKNIRGLFKKYFWKELYIEAEKQGKTYFADKDPSVKFTGLDFIKGVYKKKKESEFVNHYLKKLCVTHFEIKINEEKELENIDIIFKTGRKKKGIKYSLSDGEKTALSFAYFLSKTRHEILENEEENLANYLVVIDDPISSLDENRLFSTALLIKEFFGQDSNQLFVLSHNLVFLKFIGNILDKKNEEREDFLIENGSISGLPKALQNYQTSYFHKIKKIQGFLNKDIDYESAKEFLPNHIRIVLETFLSFKCCRLNSGSSSDKYKSAGLERLIPALNGGSLNNFQDTELIKKENIVDILWDIKKKVDPECHGTPQDITHLEYLSEKELRLISNQTIGIIEFLDQIHFTRTTA